MAKLLLQTEAKLHPVIRRYGCNLRCLQAIIEQESGTFLTADAINALYDLGLKSGIIGPNCYINDNNALLKQSAHYVGLSRAPQVVPKGGRYIRLCYLTKYGNHFVLLSNEEKLFNPDPALEIIKINGVRYYD